MRIQSFSSISSFRQCPKKYSFRYIEKVKPGPPNKALIHGRKIHSKIAKGKIGDKELDYAAQYKSKTAKITGFARNVFADKENIFIEFTEERFGITSAWLTTEYTDKKAIFRGVVDYARVYLSREKLATTRNLFEAVQEVEVLDWKTGTSRADPRQLETYSLYFAILFDCCNIRLKEVYVTKEETREWKITEKNLEEVKSWILENINTINKNDDWQPKPSGLCDYCEFLDLCPAHVKMSEKSSLSSIMGALKK